MTWYVPVFLRILVANGLFAVLLKLIAGKHSRIKRLLVQFLFCAVLSLVAAVAFSRLEFTWLTLAIGVTGMASAIGAYCQWRAVDISMARNSLFTFWDDIIAMGLSIIILKEGRSLNAGIGLGILLSLAAVILFVWSNYQKQANQKEISPRFFLYVGCYSLIWGVASFLMKYYGLHKVPVGTFLFAWYSGTVISSLGMLAFYRPSAAERRAAAPLKPRDIAMLAALSLCVIVSLGLSYWAYQLAPQNVVQPYFLLGEMILPTFLGLFIFYERKHLERREYAYFALAILGGILIGINFRG